MPAESTVADAAHPEWLSQICALTRDGAMIERAAVAMWDAEGGDTLLTWSVLSDRSRQGWRRRATAALRAFDAHLAAERQPAVLGQRAWSEPPPASGRALGGTGQLGPTSAGAGCGASSPHMGQLASGRNTHTW